MNSAWQLATQLTRSGATRTTLRFIDRPFRLPLRASFHRHLKVVIKLPTIVLFVTSATAGLQSYKPALKKLSGLNHASQFVRVRELKSGAGDEDRTRNFQLGKLTLYH